MSIMHRGAITPHTPRSHVRPNIQRVARAVVTVASIVSIAACERADASQRAQQLDSGAARRLVGTWDVTFTADRRATLSLASTDSIVAGTLAFTADHHGPTSTAGLRDITHEGSYDLDFEPLGWTTRRADAPAIAVARVVSANANGTAASRGPDSIVVVLSPGTERFAVRMAGAFAGDSAWGEWSARAYSAGGGAGRFVMRRHAN